MSPVADIDEFSYRHMEEPTARYQRKREFERICTAYNVLRDPVLRAKYDAGRVRLATAAILARKVAKEGDSGRKSASQTPKSKISDLDKPKDDMCVATTHIAKRMYDEMNSADDMVTTENDKIPENKEILLESGKSATTPLKSDDQHLSVPIQSMLANNTPNEHPEADILPGSTSPRKPLRLCGSEPETPANRYISPPNELTREEKVMRNLSELRAQMDQESGQAEDGNFQNKADENEKKYIYVKDMKARRYVKVLLKD